MNDQPLEIVKKIVGLAGQVIEQGEPIGEIHDKKPSEYIIPARIYDELFTELGKLDNPVV